MDKPRILVIDNSVEVTGALKSIVGTANNLKENFNFTFVLPEQARTYVWVKRRGFNSLYELNLKELNKSLTRVIIYLPMLIWNAILLKRIIKKERIDMLHGNDIYNLLPVLVKFLGCRVPYVSHIRFLPDKFPPWLFNVWLRAHLHYADKIIVVSNSVLNNLKPHPKFILIYDGLPEEERHADTLKREGEQPVFLYLSNFIQGKGQEFALEAFYEVQKVLPNWKLRFVGGDMGLVKNKDFRVWLYQRAEALNIIEKTEWCAFTEDVEKEYKLADIVLNFSESESFSITCAEALFFGRPLIATDCGGPAEIIEHGKTGLLVPNRDIQAMATAMIRLMTNSGERGQLAAQAKKNIREKFKSENTSHRIMNIYTSILNKK